MYYNVIMTDNKWGGKREGAGRPKGTNNKKLYTFRLSEKELKAVRELLAKMRGKLIILLCLFALCVPVFADTLQGNITYTEETARQEAFKGVKQFSGTHIISWDSGKYFLNIETIKNNPQVLCIAKINVKRLGIPMGHAYAISYKDEPNREYIYIRYLGKYIVKGTTTAMGNGQYPQKFLKYDRYGHLLSIEFNTGLESFIYDKDGNLISYWLGQNGKSIKSVEKMKTKVIYSAP